MNDRTTVIFARCGGNRCRSRRRPFVSGIETHRLLSRYHMRPSRAVPRPRREARRRAGDQGWVSSVARSDRHRRAAGTEVPACVRWACAFHAATGSGPSVARAREEGRGGWPRRLLESQLPVAPPSPGRAPDADRWAVARSAHFARLSLTAETLRPSGSPGASSVCAWCLQPLAHRARVDAKQVSWSRPRAPEGSPLYFPRTGPAATQSIRQV